MKNVIALILSLILILSATYAIAEDDECFDFYAVVTSLEEYDAETWLVTCTTKYGAEWQYYCDRGDHRIGSFIHVTVWTPGMEIVDVEECGWMAPIVMDHFLE